MKRLECLDGLRGLLAVYVMVSHMAPFAVLPPWVAHAASHGGAAVDVFFILSGLVIVGSLEKYHHQVRPFLIARAARIFPVFLAVFAFALAVQPIPRGFQHMDWLPPDSLARGLWAEGWPRLWPLDILAHLTMTHGLFPNGVLPHVWISLLGAAWSLSTEWQFYILALLLGRRLGGGDHGLRIMAWALVALAAFFWAWHQVLPDAWQFSRAFLGNKGHFFALGVVSALVVRRGGAGLWDYLPVLAATLALCATQGSLGKLLPPLVWTLCLAAQLRPGWPGLAWPSAVLRSSLLQWLGALSYCIYLTNEPVQKLFGSVLAWSVQGDAVLFTAIWLPGAILLPVLASAWLHKHVETPGLAWGRAWADGLSVRRTLSHGV
ncbi:MAG: acyltransferase family protein [Acetobacteraceae bacterium]